MSSSTWKNQKCNNFDRMWDKIETIKHNWKMILTWICCRPLNFLLKIFVCVYTQRQKQQTKHSKKTVNYRFESRYTVLDFVSWNITFFSSFHLIFSFFFLILRPFVRSISFGFAWLQHSISNRSRLLFALKCLLRCLNFVPLFVQKKRINWNSFFCGILSDEINSNEKISFEN